LKIVKTKKFKSNDRFRRAIGIITEEQLQTLSTQHIAIAGLGMGGSIFLNLVRMGFSKFNIADPDIYERTNINRQRLAQEGNLKRRKDECLIEEARLINPEVEITSYREGVTLENMDAFLTGVDWVIDVVDIYAMREKLTLQNESARRKIPLITAACIGFGASYIIIKENSPTFAELSGIHLELSQQEQLERFVNCISPEIPEYMKEQLDLALEAKSYVPFVVSSVEFAAAALTAELTKLVLGMGKQIASPHGVYIDPMRMKLEIFQASLVNRAIATVHPIMKLQADKSAGKKAA
jgi:molybdopterin-synthase adenylyltransferase